MARIIVLGGGIGGVSQVYQLRDKLRGRHEITLVSDSGRFEFTPSNPWVAVGWRKPDRICVDLAPRMRDFGIRFYSQGARRIDPRNNVVELADGERLAYDWLVIATGPKLAFDEVPGLGPDVGFTQSICKTDHAAQCYADFRKLVEEPGPVVIGAAPAASCFGPAYEYAFILDTELRKRKIRNRVPMHFVTPEPYIGHLGLDGVGDTKGLMESELRNRHISWTTNARIDAVSDGKLSFTEADEGGAEIKRHEREFRHAMILPAFRGIDALAGIEGLVNPRDFVLIDEFQRNPAWPNVFAVGVCVAIPPVGPTPVPTGAPKTGYMIESMVTAVTRNIELALSARELTGRPTWNAVCLADFGDSGVAFAALPQIPPRNTNWSSRGKWVHLAKAAFEKYFLHKVRTGNIEPYYERMLLKMVGAGRLKEPA